MFRRQNSVFGSKFAARIRRSCREGLAEPDLEVFNDEKSVKFFFNDFARILENQKQQIGVPESYQKQDDSSRTYGLQ